MTVRRAFALIYSVHWVDGHWVYVHWDTYSSERLTLEFLPPDLAALSDEELKRLIDELQAREREVSYERRILHGKIDILRAELVSRLQQSGGRSVLAEVDLARLSDILAGKVTPEA